MLGYIGKRIVLAAAIGWLKKKDRTYCLREEKENEKIFGLDFRGNAERVWSGGL